MRCRRIVLFVSLHFRVHMRVPTRIGMIMTLTSTAFDLHPSSGTEHWYRITDSRYRFHVATPTSDPNLWDRYLAGAEECYEKFGVGDALGSVELRDGGDTSLFFAAIDPDHPDAPAAGVRVQGPYTDVDQSHATVEWSGLPGEAELRKMICDRLPFGVLEMKGAWIAPDAHEKFRLSSAIARAALPALAILDAQFVMATTAEYLLPQWTSSGGVVAKSIPSAPYPSEEYRTVIGFLDRTSFASHADPQQIPMMLNEVMELTRTIEWHHDRRHLRAVGR